MTEPAQRITSHPFTAWTEPDMSGTVRKRSGMMCKLCGQPKSAHAVPEPAPLPLGHEFVLPAVIMEAYLGTDRCAFRDCRQSRAAHAQQSAEPQPECLEFVPPDLDATHMHCARCGSFRETHEPAQPHNAAPDPQPWMPNANPWDGPITSDSSNPAPRPRSASEDRLGKEAARVVAEWDATEIEPPTRQVYQEKLEGLIRAALEAVVREEREACAACVETLFRKYKREKSMPFDFGRAEILEAIRARGLEEKP